MKEMDHNYYKIEKVFLIIPKFIPGMVTFRKYFS